MAKRFFDTDFFKKPLIRGLDAPYKLLYIYLIGACNHYGVWDVELEVAGIRIGYPDLYEKADEVERLLAEKGLILPIKGGLKWWLPDFCAFQYGQLKPTNRMHLSVINGLKKEGLFEKLQAPCKPLASPLQGAKDMVMEKEKKDNVAITYYTPTLEEVVATGESMMISRQICEAYYNQRQAIDWQKHGQPIVRWPYDLKAFANAWQANHAARPKKTNGNKVPDYLTIPNEDEY